MNLWMDIAAATMLFAIGNIFFGHFEYGLPKWKRLLKLFMFVGLTALIASRGGHAGTAAWFVVAATFGLSVHFIVTRKHGINPWTAEPREKYYALRGWKA